MNDRSRAIKPLLSSEITTRCVLCRGLAKCFLELPPKKYYQRGECCALFLDPACFISKEEEKLRYQEHNNDVNDPGYQKFVAPLVSAVCKTFGVDHKGLDFGAGPGPVAVKLLRDLGYTIELYDPFFWNDPKALEKKYDFIICCEVMEHFHFPAKEFSLLRSLLNPRGVLFCMTDVYRERVDFKTWYYRNDKTHVFFYHQNTLEWIRSQYEFSAMESDGRLVRFSA